MDTQHTSHRTMYLERDRIFPLLIKMALPAVVGMMVNALYNIVDTVFVGLGVGPLAIAALAIVFPIQMIVSAVAQAIGVGTASIVSRRLGEKRPEEAAKAAGTAYAAVTVATAILVAVLFLFMRPILGFFGASAEIMPYAMEYTGIVGAGFFFFSLSMCASNLIRSEGNTKASMIGMLIGALLNTVLDPLFIFGFGMGVKGAAIATVISQMASCVYLFSMYARKKTVVPIKKANLRIDLGILSASVMLGIPSFIQSAGMSILMLLVNTTLGVYGGDEAITTYGMVHKLLMIVIMPILGIAQGFQPIAGYNYGAKRFDRVRTSLWTAALTAFSIALFGYAFMMLLPRVGMSFFTHDEGLIASSARVLRIVVLFIPAAAIQITGSVYFQSVGKATEAMALSLSRQFLLLIPFVLILPRFFGLAGVWVAFPLADLLSSTITVTLLIKEVRKLARA
ncbi:MAG: MATE family efflux transporter [Spirochaetales bacterium]